MTQAARAVPYTVVDVFTTQRFEGNPLAVITDGRGLSDAEMQAIAREFGFSETTFALPPEDPAHTARLRIFTPTAELPFAGHPNVGSALVFAAEGACLGRPVGDRIAFEEGAGLVEIAVSAGPDGAPQAAVQAPAAFERGEPIAAELIAGCIGLGADAVAAERFAPCIASVGLAFAVAELRSVEALGQARPVWDGFEAAQARHPTMLDRFSLFLVAADDAAAGRFRARMFAPLGGTWEDPATGSASAAFAGLIASLAPGADAELSLRVEQGVEMGRRSLIHLAAQKRAGAVSRVVVSGSAADVMRGTLRL